MAEKNAYKLPVIQHPAPAQHPLQQQLQPQQQQPIYYGAVAHSSWATDMWDCFQPAELCLKACCLPCIVYGKTQHRLQNPTLAGYQPLNNDCCIWSAAQYCGLGCILTLLQRQAIRQKYGIPGDTLEDGFFSWCCHCCALMQQEKEVEQRSRNGNGFQQGYVRPEGMEMRPQQ
ncbi:DUF614 domain protein [Rutstroemia sp. NJR-2017a BVV2]|nr:DUF614 domain protein [Rutstroemia sp. NJR-2017a BVV2]PQE09375.1 DUF614 domain protein [Rutstroemia sp. NJR-2017a BVV2]